MPKGLAQCLAPGETLVLAVLLLGISQEVLVKEVLLEEKVWG